MSSQYLSRSPLCQSRQKKCSFVGWVRQSSSDYFIFYLYAEWITEHSREKGFCAPREAHRLACYLSSLTPCAKDSTGNFNLDLSPSKTSSLPPHPAFLQAAWRRPAPALVFLLPPLYFCREPKLSSPTLLVAHAIATRAAGCTYGRTQRPRKIKIFPFRARLQRWLGFSGTQP